LNTSNFSSGGGTGTSVSPNNHMGRLVQVVDKGVQVRQPYQGQAKDPAQMVSLTFELPYERIEIEGASKPRWISITMTASTSPKAKLSKFLQVLDPSGQTPSLGDLIGTPVMVNVVQKRDAQGNPIEGTKLEGITSVPQGFEVPPLENEPRVFDFDNPDLAVFDLLPEWMQKDITSAVNFPGSPIQQLLANRPVQQPQGQPQQGVQPPAVNPAQLGQPPMNIPQQPPQAYQAPAPQGYQEPAQTATQPQQQAIPGGTGTPVNPTPAPQGQPMAQPQYTVQGSPATVPGQQPAVAPAVNGQLPGSQDGNNQQPPATPAY
jgi:hypothetical protein